MGEITKLTGRVYHCFDYYGAPDADRIIIAMGSVNDVVEANINAPGLGNLRNLHISNHIKTNDNGV